jgi:hypothetical protein
VTLNNEIAQYIARKSFEPAQKNFEIKLQAFSDCVYQELIPAKEIARLNNENWRTWISYRKCCSVYFDESGGQSQRYSRSDLMFSKEMPIPVIWVHSAPSFTHPVFKTEWDKLKSEERAIADAKNKLEKTIKAKLAGFSFLHKAIEAWPELLELLPPTEKSEYLTPVSHPVAVVDFSDVNLLINQAKATSPLVSKRA